MRKSQSCKNEVWCNGARIQAKDLEIQPLKSERTRPKEGETIMKLEQRDQDKIRQGQAGQGKEFEFSSKMGVTDSFLNWELILFYLCWKKSQSGCYEENETWWSKCERSIRKLQKLS